MPRCNRRAADERFERELARLRLKIDLLPESQRPHLVELADAIEQQHRRAPAHEHPSDAHG